MRPEALSNDLNTGTFRQSMRIIRPVLHYIIIPCDSSSDSIPS